MRRHWIVLLSATMIAGAAANARAQVNTPPVLAPIGNQSGTVGAGVPVTFTATAPRDTERGCWWLRLTRPDR